MNGTVSLQTLWKNGRSSAASLISLSVLILSFLLGQQASSLVLAGVLGLVGAGAALIRPQFGPLFVLLAALAFPYDIGTGTEVPLTVAALLAPALVALNLARNLLQARSQTDLLYHPVIRWSVVFGGIATVAFLVGYVFWPVLEAKAPWKVQASQLFIYYSAMSAIWLVAGEIDDVIWLKRLVYVFIIVGGAQIFGMLVPIMGRFIPAGRGAHGGMFWVWLTAMVGSQLLFNKSLRRPFRFLLLSILVLIFFRLLSDRDWTSGWLPATAIFIVLLLMRYRRGRWLFLFLIVVFLLLGVNRIYEFAGGDTALISTGMPRLVLYSAALQPVWQRPLLGAGMTAYRYFHLNEPLVYRGIVWQVPKISSHNDFVDVLAQTGFLGLISLLGLLFSLTRTAWKNGTMKHGRLDFEVAFANGVFAGLIGTVVVGMLGNWVLPFIYNGGFAGFRASLPGWLLMGGVVALDRVKRHFHHETTQVKQAG